MTPIRPLRVTESRWRYAPHLLAIALLWAIAMTMDYHDQADRANARAEQMAEQMARCLNGTWRGVTPSGWQIGCMPAEAQPPEQTR